MGAQGNLEKTSSSSDSESGRFMIPRQQYPSSSFQVEHPSAAGRSPKIGMRRKAAAKTCLWVTLATLVVAVAVGLILAFTVFKVRRPVISVDSVTLEDINPSIGLGSLFGGNGGVHLNLSLGVDVSVYNPNMVGRVRYDNSSARLEYGGEEIGVAPIPAGRMGPKQTLPLNLTLVLMADRFLSDSRELLSDVIAGNLPLSTNTTITGKVTVFHFIKFRVISRSRCNFTVFISNRTVSDHVCSYKTKL